MIYLNNLKKEKYSFNLVINSWLLYKKQSIKESTYFNYKYNIEKYISPVFEGFTIKELKNYDYNIFVNDLIKSVSIKTTKDIVILLKQILKYIERKYDIDFKLDLLTIPSSNNNEITILQKKEQSKLIQNCVEKNTLRDIGIIICFYTGIRIGEVCALKWKDIDLKNNLISINKSLQRVYKGKNKSTISIGPPKTKKSVRKVPINKKIHNLLYMLMKSYKYSDNCFLLTGLSSKYIEPRNMQYMFSKRLNEINLPHYNFHVLRHTFATECIKVNMDIKSLSELLGHANVNITLSRYVHSNYENQRIYLEKLSNFD